MGDHHVQRDAQRGFQPVHHHAQAVAHQHHVDMVVEQPRGVGVVAGQHTTGLAFLWARISGTVTRRVWVWTDMAVLRRRRRVIPQMRNRRIIAAGLLADRAGDT